MERSEGVALLLESYERQLIPNDIISAFGLAKKASSGLDEAFFSVFRVQTLVCFFADGAKPAS